MEKEIQVITERIYELEYEISELSEISERSK